MSKFKHRAVSAAVTVAVPLVSLFIPCHAYAETAEQYPSRPVRIVVPFTAGGATDSLARTLAERMAKATGQSFVVENRPGASTAIGADAVARASGDGYTLMVTIGSTVSLVPRTSKVAYNAETAFRPIVELARTPMVMYATPGIPSKDLKGLVAWAKANAGKLSYASFSTGTQGHFAGVQLNKLAGMDMLHVAYKGSAPAMQDLLGGQVQILFDAILPGMNYVKAGKLVALATAGKERSSFAPTVPTFRELGYPQMEQFNGYFGLFAPSAVGNELAARIERIASVAVNSPEFRQRLTEFGVEPPVATQMKSFTQQVKDDQASWAEFVTKIGYKPEN